mmetsp:Transcript_20675/g.51276  ORF Transcript_20675/g.51276 Transcript_20675/m.51276 type:complete len:90 (-) Transcript_20675:128-397(-)
MRVEDALPTAMHKDDEDVDDWQLRLVALDANAKDRNVSLCDMRLKLRVIRGLRAAYNTTCIPLGHRQEQQAASPRNCLGAARTSPSRAG